MIGRPYLADYVAGHLHNHRHMGAPDLRIATQIAIDREGAKHLVGRGAQALFAKNLGIQPNSLSDFLCGRRGPPPKLLEHFGLEQEVRYVRKSED